MTAFFFVVLLPYKLFTIQGQPSLLQVPKKKQREMGQRASRRILTSFCQRNCAIFYVYVNHSTRAFANIKCTVRSPLRGPVDVHCKFFEI